MWRLPHVQGGGLDGEGRPCSDEGLDDGAREGAPSRRSPSSCGRPVVAPNAYVAKGQKKGIMPATYGKALSKKQLDDLVAFLVKG